MKNMPNELSIIIYFRKHSFEIVLLPYSPDTRAVPKPKNCKN